MVRNIDDALRVMNKRMKRQEKRLKNFEREHLQQHREAELEAERQAEVAREAKAVRDTEREAWRVAKVERRAEREAEAERDEEVLLDEETDEETEVDEAVLVEEVVLDEETEVLANRIKYMLRAGPHTRDNIVPSFNILGRYPAINDETLYDVKFALALIHDAETDDVNVSGTVRIDGKKKEGWVTMTISADIPVDELARRISNLDLCCVTFDVNVFEFALEMDRFNDQGDFLKNLTRQFIFTELWNLPQHLE